ncbi:DUF4422 domain-containing protein [Palleronia rufa]|uniref:DUF4422 domain-containing protein n=1 Tax=Palleronia rufa TaxID=1530186 RepID=UPI000565D30E|nr:DUF4422 domain-containing protein [Palleronia rufa]
MSHAPSPRVPECPAAIYIAYHKPGPLIASAALRPIHVGRAGAAAALEGMETDAAGVSISERNASYCELTAHYWAWRNDAAAPVLGLMHYRRVLDLDTAPASRRRPWEPSERFVRRFDAALYASRVDGFLRRMERGGPDLVVPHATRLRCSAAAQFRRFHDPRDLTLLREAVGDLSSEFLPDLDRALGSWRVIVGNIFVMRRPVFEHYSALLFPVLDAVYDALTPELGARDPYQARVIGFLAERMLTAYAHGELLRTATSGIVIESRAILNTDWPQVGRMRLRRRLLTRWNGLAALVPARQ